jgi:hypothetical protein
VRCHTHSVRERCEQTLCGAYYADEYVYFIIRWHSRKFYRKRTERDKVRMATFIATPDRSRGYERITLCVSEFHYVEGKIGDQISQEFINSIPYPQVLQGRKAFTVPNEIRAQRCRQTNSIIPMIPVLSKDCTTITLRIRKYVITN